MHEFGTKKKVKFRFLIIEINNLIKLGYSTSSILSILEKDYDLKISRAFYFKCRKEYALKNLENITSTTELELQSSVKQQKDFFEKRSFKTAQEFARNFVKETK